MRTLLLVGLMTTLALGCGDDDASMDGGPAADAGSTTDVGSARDAGTSADAAEVDGGPAADAGAESDAGAASDAGSDVDAGDNSCGGFVGMRCAVDGDFCEYARGCGFADGLGMCVTPPESCPRILDPVCGCDGNDYGNPCMAQMAGQSVASRGRCEVAEVRCGGRGGVACRDTQYCAFSRDEICGRADAMSTCMTRPLACPDIFRPVCGCDGFDYGNECEANSAGVAVLNDGTCD